MRRKLAKISWQVGAERHQEEETARAKSYIRRKPGELRERLVKKHSREAG